MIQIENPATPLSVLANDGRLQGDTQLSRDSLAHANKNKQQSSKKCRLGNSTSFAAKVSKSELYSLLDTAQTVLKPLKHRTCGCSRYVAEFNNPEYQVPIVSDGKRHSYKNITVCGSVWACPVCAYKIQSVRTNQIIQAIRYEPLMN